MPLSGFPVGNQFPTAGFIGKADLHTRIDVNLDTLYGALYGSWSSWTPAITSSGSPTQPNLGTGFASNGRFRVLGDDICVFAMSVTWGTSPVAGSAGQYRFSLPVNWQNDGIAPVFIAQLTIPAVSVTSFLASPNTASTMVFNRGDATANLLGPSYPSAPVVGWNLLVSGTYRCGT